MWKKWIEIQSAPFVWIWSWCYRVILEGTVFLFHDLLIMLFVTCYPQHCDKLLSGPAFNLHQHLLWPLWGHDRAGSFFMGKRLRYTSCIVLRLCLCVSARLKVLCIGTRVDCGTVWLLIVHLIAWSDCSFQAFTTNVAVHWRKECMLYCIFCYQIRGKVSRCTYNGKYLNFRHNKSSSLIIFFRILVWWTASLLSIRSD